MIVLIKISGILKEIDVASLPHLALKAPLKMNISMYYMIHRRNKYTDT